MIVDCHVHICPERVRNRREDFLQAEPEFSAIYSDPKARLIGASKLIETMDEQHVDRAVVFGFPWRREDHFRLNNDYVLEAAARFPDRLIPFACVFAGAPGACDEARRCIDLGARGIGELAFYDGGLDQTARQALFPLASLAAEAGIPVLLHTNEPVGHSYPGKSPMTLDQLYRLVAETSETSWMLAHLGGGLPFFASMKKQVPEVLAGCWFDTAAMPFLYKPRTLRFLTDMLGPDKLLFGSDYPLLPPKRYFKELAQSGLTEEEQQALLGGNAAKLLQLSEPEPNM